MEVKELKKIGSISITTGHNDKMAGLWSLSTAPSCNPNCIARVKNPGMICAHCYSVTMNKRFKNLRTMLEHNADVVTRRALPDIEMPEIKSPSGFFRFEAFGDLINTNQVINYFKIAAANPGTACALWTKNPWIIADVIKQGHKKPENLRIIGSSYFLNQPMTDYYKKFDFIDNVFTVYTPGYASANNITINCGARSCASCGKCYTGKHANYEINELLK